MAVHMAKTIKEERLRWVRPIVEGTVSVKDAARTFPYGLRTLERWLAAYKRGGEDALEPRSTRPKTSPKETAIRIKEEVITLRKKRRACALKLKWQLAKKGIALHERTIGKIVKAEGLVRRYRTRKVKCIYVKAVLRPGELIEIDVKHVPGKIAGMQYFQYTAIDVATRWRYLRIYEEESSLNSVSFFADVIARFPHRITGLKTDNHSTFTNRYIGTNKRSDMTMKTLHALDMFCAANSIVHYLIDPGKPAQNGTVERSHRSDQETLYDTAVFRSANDLRRKLAEWNTLYNDLEHCGLDGKTPNEAVAEYKLISPPYVRT